MNDAAKSGEPDTVEPRVRSRMVMDPAELLARATLAGALIMSRAVEIPSVVPHSGTWTDDPAAVRLRDLTDYLYQVLAARADGSN